MATKTVLIVSEDPKFFEDPDNAFEARGCDVFVAMSGKEAITFLTEHGAHLVLCNGPPPGADPSDITAVLGDCKLIVIAREADDVEAWRAEQSFQVIKAPVEGKSLLKLTTKVLGMPDRKYISILVQVRVALPKATTIFGKSRDLSETGIMVETNQTLTVHDTVVVSFLIPGADRMIQNEALVTREAVKPGGGRRYGLKFLGLAEEDASIVADFVSGKLAT